MLVKMKVFLNKKFSYSIPNFDRSKVKGLVAELINLDLQHAQYSTALELYAFLAHNYNFVYKE